MALSFEDLKKQRADNLLKTKQKFAAATTNGQTNNNEFNDTLWKPTPDKAGNGYAVIRFLPSPAGEDDPFVRVWMHSFQGPTGSWYIEKCLSTIGQNDPVNEHNTKLWNSGLDSDKEVARKQKRKLHFYSNIYVVKDPGNPENEGKVFLYRYGKKIFDKLNSAMNPEFDDETPIDPFDLWAGANFRLKFRKGEYGPDYSDSAFLEAGPLFKKDADMEAIFNQEHSLQALIDPKSFKSYDELTKRLNRVLGLGQPAIAVPGPVAEARVGKSAPAPKFEESDEDLTDSQIDDILAELD